MDKSKNTVAETILRQLGGQRFCVMTGAKNLMSDDTRGRGSLTMKLPRMLTRNGITHVRITLTEGDDYTLECLKVRGVNCTTEKVFGRITVEQLQTMFTAATGMDTHL